MAIGHTQSRLGRTARLVLVGLAAVACAVSPTPTPTPTPMGSMTPIRTPTAAATSTIVPPTASPSPAATPTIVRTPEVTTINLAVNPDDLAGHGVGPWDGLWVSDVAAGGPGFVAVGSDPYGGQVWTSPDGEMWDRLPDDPQWMDTAIYRVTAWNGMLVAAGTDNHDHVVFWTSNDGIEWNRVRDTSSLSFRVDRHYYGGLIYRFAPIDDTLSAVGWPGCSCGVSNSGPALVPWLTWTTRDGISWQRARSDPPGHSYGPPVRTDSGWLRVGEEALEVSSDADFGLIQASEDAVSWTTMFLGPGLIMHGVYRFRSGFVALTHAGPIASTHEMGRWDGLIADDLGLSRYVSGLANNGLVTVAVGTITEAGLATGPGTPTVWVYPDMP